VDLSQQVLDQIEQWILRPVKVLHEENERALQCELL
jgi:hypothetical protein